MIKSLLSMYSPNCVNKEKYVNVPNILFVLLDPTKIRNLPRRPFLFWRQIQSPYQNPCLCPYSKVRRISPDVDPRYFNWKKCPVAHGIRTCSEAQIILLAEIAEVEVEVPDPRTFGGPLTATVIKSKINFFYFRYCNNFSLAIILRHILCSVCHTWT